MEKKNERIFISYKRVDKERVDALRKDIEQATGEPCWIDRDGIESDAQFVEVIMKAIDQCEVFLFMRSKEHNNITNYRTDWTIREVNYALEEKKRIIFISLDNSPLPRWFKFMFPQQQETDASDTTKLERFYADLRSWLKVEEKKEKSAPITRITMAPVKYYIGTLKGHTSRGQIASFSPDGKKIVSTSNDGSVRIWDAEIGICTKRIEGVNLSVSFATFSPNSKEIVLAKENNICIYDTETGKCTRTIKGHTNYVFFAAFSPDGKNILSISRDNTVRIWNAQTGEFLKKLKRHNTYDAHSAAFSPDGKKIVSTSNGRKFHIWDAETGECIKNIEEEYSPYFYNYSAAFCPDGKKIVITADNAHICDAETGDCIKILEGHERCVTTVAFSPDGKRIVSASADKTVRIWDAATGDCLRTLEGHSDYVNSASFSPDGKCIISASEDGTVRIWDISDL